LLDRLQVVDRDNLAVEQNFVHPHSPGKRSALVVVDFQNDFVTEYTNQPIMARATTSISRVVDWARQARFEVIFVPFLGDEQFQPASWRHRDQMQGRRPWCMQWTWGAEICNRVTVQAGERVFDKRAQFDPFLDGGFSQYVARRGFEHLMIVGLYADICVDATLRGAFQ
jgi:nicotinamidase-related amidase